MNKTFIIFALLLFYNQLAFAAGGRFFNMYSSGQSSGSCCDASQIQALGKFDVLLMNFFQYDDYSPDPAPTCTKYHSSATTWNSICDVNPDILILPYTTHLKVQVTDNCSTAPNYTSNAHYDTDCNSLGTFRENDGDGAEDDYIMRDDSGGDVLAGAAQRATPGNYIIGSATKDPTAVNFYDSGFASDAHWLSSNASCTSSGVPLACCTGLDTGDCADDDYNGMYLVMTSGTAAGNDYKITDTVDNSGTSNDYIVLGGEDLYTTEGIRDTDTYLIIEWLWLNFGDSSTQDFTNSVISNSFLGQNWAADGLFSDTNNCRLGAANMYLPSGTIETAYNTEAKWRTAMLSSWSSLVTYLDTNHSGQKFLANAGPMIASSTDCVQLWNDADDEAKRPWGLMFEQAFTAVAGANDLWVYNLTIWQNQVEAIAVENMNTVPFITVGPLGPSSDSCNSPGNCIDQLSNPIDYAQMIMYVIGSFAVAKDNLDYVAFVNYDGADYIVWPDVYDELDPGDNLHLGNALNTYQELAPATYGATVYWRAFDRGLVIVNPDIDNDMTSAFDFDALYPRVSRILDYDGTDYGIAYDTANPFNGITEANDHDTVQLDSNHAVFVLFQDTGSKKYGITGKGLTIN